MLERPTTAIDEDCVGRALLALVLVEQRRHVWVAIILGHHPQHLQLALVILGLLPAAPLCEGLDGDLAAVLDVLRAHNSREGTCGDRTEYSETERLQILGNVAVLELRLVGDAEGLLLSRDKGLLVAGGHAAGEC